MNPRAVFKDKESVLFILQVHLEIPSIYPSFSPSLSLHCWLTAGNFVAFLMIFNKHYKMASLCSVLLRLHFSISSLAGSHNLWRQVTERDPWDGWQQRSISVSHSTIANFHPKAPAAAPPGTYSRRVIITIIGRECGYPRNVFVSGWAGSGRVSINVKASVEMLPRRPPSQGQGSHSFIWLDAATKSAEQQGREEDEEGRTRKRLKTAIFHLIEKRKTDLQLLLSLSSSSFPSSPLRTRRFKESSSFLCFIK